MTADVTLSNRLQLANSEQAVGVLSKHGKSFHFAGLFLPKDQLLACARLYRFCRYLDDIADDTKLAADAIDQLQLIETELDTGSSVNPVVIDFLHLVKSQSIDLAPVKQLIQGLLSDLNTVAVKDDAQLKVYSYRVAGCVGLLMCDVLGVHDSRAYKHAIDLGIAMQLTNIARDVAEDARHKRRYLPATWVGNLSTVHIASADVWHRKKLQHAVQKLILEAEHYYDSAEHGLGYLPWRARLAILIAARVYRDIGHQLARKDFATWLGRAHVSKSRKIWLAVRACIAFSFRPKFHRTGRKHDHNLHRALFNLPGSYFSTHRSGQRSGNRLKPKLVQLPGQRAA